MESLIAVINELQDVFNTVNQEIVQLPQIVVIGSQSAGKSSVIEALVKGSFLPRGSGIVTRRPLVLQLINCPVDDTKFRSTENGTQDCKHWGEFLHKPNEIYFEFSAICDEIEGETDRVAGANKGIVSTPINLKIFSPDVVNLTLVDLPGLTKVPVGDQPADIEMQIKKLVTQYIKNPDSIILAVTAANTDLATSEALKIAKNIDPEGVRTLAVLTKLDLMDEGTDAFDVLSGSLIPVKLGIIGVVNRSQKGITENKALDDQLEMEEKFLMEKYPTLAAKNGTSYLAKALNRLLSAHISKCLPELRQRVNAKTAEIEALTELHGKEIIDKDLTLIGLIKKFSSAYKTTIEGIRGNADVDNSFGKTRLFKILHEEFEEALEGISLDSKHTEDEISSWLEAFGPRPKLFDIKVFDFAFERIVKDQIFRLHGPVVNCLDLVYQELIRNIHNCGSDVQQELQRFPKLQDKIIDVTTKLLRQQLETAKQRVHDVVAIEMTYVNKEHPDFHQEAALKYGSNGNILGKLVIDYYNIVRKTVQDTVPKTIMHFLVNVVKEQVDSELLLHVYKPAISEMLDALVRAKQIIGDISDRNAKLRNDVMM